MLDFHISKSLVTCSSRFHCFIDELTKFLTLTTTPTPPCTSVSSYVGPYHKLYDSQSMQLSMMLTAAYNVSLPYCQLGVDILHLSIPFCIPFVLMVIFFFEVSIQFFSYLLVTSRSKLGM